MQLLLQLRPRIRLKFQKLVQAAKIRPFQAIRLRDYKSHCKAIVNLDGTTVGPNAFSGPIGRELPVWEGKPIVPFERIDFVYPESTDMAKFNSDQLYLLEMCKAISNGHCPEELAKRSPGKLSHARWLTAANLILRLYVSTRKPSQNLKLLVNYIMKVYAAMVFNIKYKPSIITHGAVHFAELVKYSRCMPEKVRSIIDPIIKRNAYFAHSENVLLAMLDDDRQFIRELAYHRIVQARAIPSGASICV